MGLTVALNAPSELSSDIGVYCKSSTCRGDTASAESVIFAGSFYLVVVRTMTHEIVEHVSQTKLWNAAKVV